MLQGCTVRYARQVVLVLVLAAGRVGAAEPATVGPVPATGVEAADETAQDVDPFADPAALDPNEGKAGNDTPEQAAVRAALARSRRDPTAPDPAPVDPSLRPVFEEFGGEAGLAALMDDLLARLVRDPRLAHFFVGKDVDQLKRHLTAQVCAILGGGCAYTGRDMRTSHEGQGITRADFNAVVEHLQRAMSARRIPFRAQNRLLARLAPMHREIEQR